MKIYGFRISVWLIISVLLGTVLNTQADTLVISNLFDPTNEHGRVEIVKTDGSGRETLREVGGGLRGVVADIDNGLLYWSDVNARRIEKSELDNPFGPPEQVTENVQFPQDIEFSASAQKLFWVDAILNQIVSANLDGSEQTPLVSVTSTTLVVDEINRKIYTENRVTGSRGDLVRFDFDGTNVETIIADIPTATALAVDPVRQTVFWTSSAGLTDGDGGVYRVNYDGSDFRELFVMGANLDTSGIVVDVDNAMVYWGQNVAANRSSIYRMDLDGDTPVLVSAGYGNISEMRLVPDFTVAPLEVVIDIRPGNGHNIINLRSPGQVWVAVLSDAETGFDSPQIDVASARFGPAGASPNHHRVQDINDDGVEDLLLRFSIPDTGITAGDTSASLSSRTVQGQRITGSDAIVPLGRVP